MADKTALVIDDSKVYQNILTNRLEEKGYVVHSAYNGEEGLEKYKSVRPYITFLDIVMPKISGLDLLKDLRSHYSDSKIIISTSLTSIKIVREAKQMGADWFILKPYNDEQIDNVLKRFEEN